MANSSCDIPNIEPCGRLTPTTRNGTPRILMRLPMGSTAGKSLSAVSQPSTATLRLRRTSVGVMRRPSSALKVGNRPKSSVTPWISTESST